MGKGSAFPYGYTHPNAYQITLLTGDIAAGAGAASEILQFRWSATSTGAAAKLCLIQEIALTGMRASTAFAVGNIDIVATAARAYTANGTGGATATMTTNNAKLQTAMQTSSVGEIRVATTAALGAGTKTFDAQDLGRITTHSSGGTGSATPIVGNIHLPLLTLFNDDEADNEGPIVLATNEGFSIRATVPGTGVWSAGFKIRWIELIK